MNGTRLSEEERVRAIVTAMIHRAVQDWKALKSRGIDPYDCSYRDGTRTIDPECEPSDVRNLVEFFNSRAVESLLNALHFPADPRRGPAEARGAGDGGGTLVATLGPETACRTGACSPHSAA